MKSASRFFIRSLSSACPELESTRTGTLAVKGFFLKSSRKVSPFIPGKNIGKFWITFKSRYGEVRKWNVIICARFFRGNCCGGASCYYFASFCAVTGNNHCTVYFIYIYIYMVRLKKFYYYVY